MQYFSCGSDKYSEIKMRDLEPFSKIRSHILLLKFLYTQFRRLAHGFSLLVSIIMGIMLLLTSSLMANLYVEYCRYVKHHSYRHYYPYYENDYPLNCGHNEQHFLMLPLFGFITMVVWVRY